MLITVDDYAALITSWHATRQKFVAVVKANVQPYIDMQSAIYGLIPAFDIDLAVGQQLDILGQWIGRSRNVPVPIPDLWFAINNEKKGFDRGLWRQPYDTGSEINKLPDEEYRRLLKTRILLNRWDGTIEPLEYAVSYFFSASFDTFFFVEDRQDMSCAFCFTGKWPDPVGLCMIEQQIVARAPMGIQTYYQVTTIEDQPLFGFDVSSVRIAGFDEAAWGAPPSYIVENLM